MYLSITRTLISPIYRELRDPDVIVSDEDTRRHDRNVQLFGDLDVDG